MGIEDSEIAGNLSCTNNSTAGCSVLRNDIHGNVQMDGNSGADADHNTIGGNLQFNDNYIVAIVIDNIIGGNLQCQGNTGEVVGSGNTVGGHKQGQCAGF